MSKGTEFLTPVGRLVQGSPFEGQTKDAEGKPLVVKNGLNAGQPRVSYFIALAIPKTDPGYPAIWSAIHGEAKAGFPHMFNAAGSPTRPDFAFKVVDGDSAVPNKKGIAPNTREGYPGHWVLNFSNGFAPKVVAAGGATLVTDPQALKRGDYIRVHSAVRGNGAENQPGVYLNFDAVEIVGYGEEIVTGIDTSAVFGGTPAGALPPGASTTPTAPAMTSTAMLPTPVVAPVAAPMAAAPMAAPVAPAPMAAPVAPTVSVQPAPDILNPPTAVKVMTAKANGVPYEGFTTAKGWTDALLIQHGLMRDPNTPF